MKISWIPGAKFVRKLRSKCELFKIACEQASDFENSVGAVGKFFGLKRLEIIVNCFNLLIGSFLFKFANLSLL